MALAWAEVLPPFPIDPDDWLHIFSLFYFADNAAGAVSYTVLWNYNRDETKWLLVAFKKTHKHRQSDLSLLSCNCGSDIHIKLSQ